MLITLFVPALNKDVTISLSKQVVKELRARMAIGISLHMFPLETRRVKAKRDWDVKEFKDYNLVYFNNQWHLKDKVSANNTSLSTTGRGSSKSNNLAQIPKSHARSNTATSITWDEIS